MMTQESRKTGKSLQRFRNHAVRLLLLRFACIVNLGPAFSNQCTRKHLLLNLR